MSRMKKINIIIVGLLLAMSAGGCKTTKSSVKPQVPLLRHEGFYLRDMVKMYDFDLSWDSLTQTITLRSQDQIFKMMVDCDLFMIGEDTVQLSAPVRMVGSSIIIPRETYDLMEPYISAGATPVPPEQKEVNLSMLPIRAIVIDPGHGGKDPGAIGVTGIFEKRIVLDIAKRLYNILSNKGVVVIMTRTTDDFISLQERTEIASRSTADLFMSIHANASTSASLNGIEIYTLKSLGYFERNEEQRQVNNEELRKHLKIDQGNSNVHEIVEDMLYGYKQGTSQPFAQKTAKLMGKRLKIDRSKTKQARFFVLRNTLVPSILVEVGYLTNAKEEALLKTADYRQMVAEALAESVLDYTKEMN